jgi:hypothetical protein
MGARMRHEASAAALGVSAMSAGVSDAKSRQARARTYALIRPNASDCDRSHANAYA